jgi:hypothetical protein
LAVEVPLDAESDAYLTQNLLEAAREDINCFVTTVMRDERTGLPLEQAEVHRAWHKLASENDRLMLWSSIESGKTSQLSIARTLFELGRDKGLRIGIVSNTAGQSQKVLRSIKRYIESSPELHAVFPDLRPSSDQWTTSAITVKRQSISKDPSIQGIGVHGNILGSRLDLLIVDDLLDVENTRSAQGREDCFAWLQAACLSRLTSKGRVLVVGTAFHPDDALHRLARMPGFKAMRYPVLLEDGTPRWAERWPPERIARVRETLGPLEFARQLLCVARSDDEARFKKEWIDVCLARGEGKQLCYGMDKLPPGFKTYTGVDLAVQQKDGSDSTVLFTIAVHPNTNDREVLNIERGKWSGPEIVSRIIDHHRRFLSIVVVENNACFAPGTRVLTSEGYKPIEQVQLGDLVWTHKGRWRPVTGTHEGTAQTTVRAQAKGCLPVVTTPNHWFWLRKAGRSSTGHHRPVGAAQWVSYGVRDEPAYAAVALPRWPALKAQFHLPETLRDAAKTVPVTEDLALVLGLFMAEGHATRGQVYWTFGKKETYLAALVEREVWKLVRGKVTLRPTDRGTLRVVVSSTQLANALRIGTGAKKCLPLKWMGWPLRLRLALVRGWLMGDGCARPNNASTKWPQWFLSGCSISRDWMMFVRSTLGQAGIPMALSASDRKTDSIEGRVVTRRPLNLLTLTHEGSSALRKRMTTPTEAERWKRWFESDAAKTRRKSNGTIVLERLHGWSKVPDMEEAPFLDNKGGAVFNLTVEEDESYTVEDFVVHNAQDFIVQFARGAFAVPIRPFTTGRNKAHPEFGIESMATELAGRKWIIPSRGGMPAHPEIATWIQEMLYYAPAAHTGDSLMASWFAREGHRLGSMRVEAGRMDVLSR